jgi:iron(III) transport system permease protein
VLGAAFAVPVLRLLAWVDDASVRFLSYLGNSAVLAGAAVLGCLAAATLLTNGVRLSDDPVTRRVARLASVGYAVPGPVVAIGVLVCLAGLAGPLGGLGLPGAGLLATGSLAGVVYAYVARFTALAYHSLDASLEKVTPAMTASALTLGATPARVLRRVHLPLTRAGLGVAALLVAVDALKELPIVLLLRDFGFQTLPVRVWQLASESRWESAALPSLVIVAAATVPVLLLLRPSGPLSGRRWQRPTASREEVAA